MRMRRLLARARDHVSLAARRLMVLEACGAPPPSRLTHVRTHVHTRRTRMHVTHVHTLTRTTRAHTQPAPVNGLPIEFFELPPEQQLPLE